MRSDYLLLYMQNFNNICVREYIYILLSLHVCRWESIAKMLISQINVEQRATRHPFYFKRHFVFEQTGRVAFRRNNILLQDRYFSRVLELNTIYISFALEHI